jgi:hypothetical protein
MKFEADSLTRMTLAGISKDAETQLSEIFITIVYYLLTFDESTDITSSAAQVSIFARVLKRVILKYEKNL